MKKTLSFLIGIAPLLVGVVWYTEPKTWHSKAGTAENGGRGSPTGGATLVLKDLHGDSVNLANLRTNTMMLDFWATWCEPCRRLKFMADQAANKMCVGADSTIVGIAMDDGGRRVIILSLRKRILT